MAIEKLQSREGDGICDMDISDIDEKQLLTVEMEFENILGDYSYSRMLINKEDAESIIKHLKQQFDL